MENITNQSRWNGFAASIPGSGHIRKGIPCQDASLTILGNHPAIIVCDGRGSAKLSHFGAQGAVDAFRRQCAIMAPFLDNILDLPNAAPETWEKFCRILYRTMAQAKLDLAAEHGCPEKEFDFTVAFAIVGKEQIGCFQVGDGAIVLMQADGPSTVFPPDKGEFANQTRFLRAGGEVGDGFHTRLIPAEQVNGIAATSDGPEHLMFQLPSMTPGPVFEKFFDDLAVGEFSRQDLMDYLTRRAWDNDPRGADDRSVALLAKQNPVEDEEGEAPVEEGLDSEPQAEEDTASAENNQTVADEPEPGASPDGEESAPSIAGERHSANPILLAVTVAALTVSGLLGYSTFSQRRQLIEAYQQIQVLTAQVELQKSSHKGNLPVEKSLQKPAPKSQKPVAPRLKTENKTKASAVRPRQKKTHGTETISTKPRKVAPDAGQIPAGSTNLKSKTGSSSEP